jgi:hypothetical protein
MANPNIVNVAGVLGRTVGSALSTSAAAIVSNSGGSNKIFKINSIIACNRDGVNNADVTVYATLDGSARYIAYQITVPAKSTLVVMSKDTAIYLEESDSITAFASASSDIDLIVSYEEIN